MTGAPWAKQESPTLSSILIWKSLDKWLIILLSMFTCKTELCVCVCSVVSNSFRCHVLPPTRLLYPWDFPGKSIGVGCHFLLQGTSQPRHQSCTSCVSSTAGGFFIWAVWEAQNRAKGLSYLFQINTQYTWEVYDLLKLNKSRVGYIEAVVEF